MPRLPKDQLHQLQIERKEQIAQAALKVFSHRGLTGTKMGMIADEAGVSHGLIYHYYNSKEELFTSLIKEAVETSHTEIKNLVQASGTPLDRLRLLTEAILDESGAPYFLLIHQARNSKEIPEEARQLIEESPLEVYINYLVPLFKEGQAAGVIIAGNLEELISAYFTVLSGVMVLGEGYPIPNPDLLLRIVMNP